MKVKSFRDTLVKIGGAPSNNANFDVPPPRRLRSPPRRAAMAHEPAFDLTHSPD